MTAQPTYPHREKLELYEKLVATNPAVERKGAANPYTSVNGNMFSIMSPAGSLALRLPEDARAAFLKKHDTRLYEAYGIVMKEYVVVPDHLLTNTNELKRYFEQSYEYTKSLKPKATTRPANKKALKARPKANPTKKKARQEKK